MATETNDQFTARIEQIKTDRHATAKRMAAEMLGKLDSAKHDPRNSEAFKLEALRKYYYANGPEGKMPVAKWDEMFSYYSDATGTY